MPKITKGHATIWLQRPSVVNYLFTGNQPINLTTLDEIYLLYPLDILYLNEYKSR